MSLYQSVCSVCTERIDFTVEQGWHHRDGSPSCLSPRRHCPECGQEVTPDRRLAQGRKGS